MQICHESDLATGIIACNVFTSNKQNYSIKSIKFACIEKKYFYANDLPFLNKLIERSLYHIRNNNRPIICIQAGFWVDDKFGIEADIHIVIWRNMQYAS